MASKFACRPRFHNMGYRPAQETKHQQKFARIQMCILTGEPCLDGAACEPDTCHDIDVLYSAANDVDRVNPMHETQPDIPEPAAAVEAEPEEPIPPHSPVAAAAEDCPNPPPSTPRLSRCRSMYDVLREARRKAIRDAALATLPESLP